MVDMEGLWGKWRRMRDTGGNGGDMGTAWGMGDRFGGAACPLRFGASLVRGMQGVEGCW